MPWLSEVHMHLFVKKKLLVVALIMAAFCGPWSGVVTPAGADDKDYILGIGDVIHIQVWEHEDLNRKVEISQEGAFTYPFVGQVQAGGLSIIQLETLLRGKLANGYLVAPQVTVAVQEYKSQKIYIFGEVRKPGTYVIKGATPLHEIIAGADGLTEKAGRQIRIVRSSGPSGDVPAGDTPSALADANTVTVSVEALAPGTTGAATLVQGGDTVYVDKGAHIYVIGEVVNPGRFDWEDGATVHQAISLAGGPSKRASMGRTKVIRVIDGREKPLSLGMNDPVQPNDIIKVPESYF